MEQNRAQPQVGGWKTGTNNAISLCFILFGVPFGIGKMPDNSDTNVADPIPNDE